MEKSIFVFPPLPSFLSLCLRHFILTSFGKSQSSFAKKGRVHQLILPLHKTPFRKTGKWIRQWEGRTQMSIFLSNNAFAENWLRTSKPAAEKLFLCFLPSTFWSFHWILIDSGDEIVTIYERYFRNMNHFTLFNSFTAYTRSCGKRPSGCEIRRGEARTRFSANLTFFVQSEINCKQISGATQSENLHRVRI